MKGIVKIKLSDGTIHIAEPHWYEVHCTGKTEIKRKKHLD